MAPDDGGSPIIDYRLWTDNALGRDFEVLVESWTSLTYTAKYLTQGSTYRFKVQAKNLYGHSGFSNVVTIPVAQVPGSPMGLVDLPTITSAS